MTGTAVWLAARPWWTLLTLCLYVLGAGRPVLKVRGMTVLTSLVSLVRLLLLDPRPSSCGREDGLAPALPRRRGVPSGIPLTLQASDSPVTLDCVIGAVPLHLR